MEENSCSGGILIKNPTKGCGDGCQCCITDGRLTASKPSPPPPVTFPPQPPGICSTSRCVKQVPGLGEGYGVCASGKYSDVCRDNGGLNVDEAEGCDVHGKECHCCILEGRFYPSSPSPSPPPPSPLQPQVCTERECRKLISDGVYGYGACFEGVGSNVCLDNGLLPGGPGSEGCGEDGCYCCGGQLPPPEVSPPPPQVSPVPPQVSPVPPQVSPVPPVGIFSPPPPPEVQLQCKSGSLCGVKNPDESYTYGRCVSGKTSNPLEECDRVGGLYLGSSSIGCSGESCFCCGAKDTMVEYSPPPPPLPPSQGVCGNLCGIEKKDGQVLYGKCLKQTKNPDSTCAQAGGVYPGDSSIGCSDGCVCCTPSPSNTPPPPPVQQSPKPSPPSLSPPPPPPPLTGGVSCSEKACGVEYENGDIALGKCFTGSSDPEKTCADNDLIYAGEESIGCDKSSAKCHCCLPNETPMVSPSPPTPPLQSPPPPPPPPTPVEASPSPSPPPPPPTCPTTCSTTLDGATLNGVCRPGNFPDLESAVAECAQVGAVPILNGCGDSCGLCCIDSGELCSSSTANGSCQDKPCKCILTTAGGSCNNPLYPGYNPPPGNGGGCQENLCNAFAAKEGVSAGCCPFGC